MSEILLEVSRGSIVEDIHRGDIVVVGNDGLIKYYKGDPFKITYLRSALKPIQALNVFLSKAVDKYNFEDEEIAIMCASHYGEDMHRKVIDNILSKIGLTLDDFLCKGAYSISEEYKTYQIANHIKLTPANSDCSGKHSGMLASCLAKGYSTKNYNSVEHPVQKDINKIVSKFCKINEEKIIIGIDGCGVPVHGMPLYNAALGYAQIANPNALQCDLRNACNRIFESMNNYPEMVAGTNGFCTELIKNTHEKLIGKLGADGVYCIALREYDLGIAIKIEDGNIATAIPPVVMRCLEDLDVLTEEEIKSLERFRGKELKNSLNNTIGKITPVFHLDKK